MKWLPINTYPHPGKKAIFIDAEGFSFIGEGRINMKGELEFWDWQDIYEPVYWMPHPSPPKDDGSNIVNLDILKR